MEYVKANGKLVVGITDFAPMDYKDDNGEWIGFDADMAKIGISITEFKIESFNYPEEIKKMQEKAAAQAMVGDVNKYTQMAMADGMNNGNAGGANVASSMMQMQMGMAMGQQMMNNMGMGVPQMQPQMQAAAPAGAKFCPNCGTPTTGTKFCANCGTQLA